MVNSVPFTRFFGDGSVFILFTDPPLINLQLLSCKFSKSTCSFPTQQTFLSPQIQAVMIAPHSPCPKNKVAGLKSYISPPDVT